MPKLGMEVVRRRQVIDAAVSILSHHGWHDLTIREVSDTAKVSAGVVTHYFASKRAIIVDTISDTNQRVYRAISAVEKKKAGASNQIAHLVELTTHPELHDLPSRNFWIALYGRSPFDPVIQAEIHRLQRWLAEAVARIVRQGVQHAEFRTDRSPEDIAASCVVMIAGQMMAAGASPGDLTADRCREILLSTLG
ncbi:MAG: TetR family transcriptional regulator, partial [Thermomicrobiales bacterium]